VVGGVWVKTEGRGVVGWRYGGLSLSWSGNTL
jgi:hypothetical protein